MDDQDHGPTMSGTHCFGRRSIGRKMYVVSVLLVQPLFSNSGYDTG